MIHRSEILILVICLLRCQPVRPDHDPRPYTDTEADVLLVLFKCEGNYILSPPVKRSPYIGAWPPILSALHEQCIGKWDCSVTKVDLGLLRALRADIILSDVELIEETFTCVPENTLMTLSSSDPIRMEPDRGMVAIPAGQFPAEITFQIEEGEELGLDFYYKDSFDARILVDGDTCAFIGENIPSVYVPAGLIVLKLCSSSQRLVLRYQVFGVSSSLPEPEDDRQSITKIDSSMSGNEVCLNLRTCETTTTRVGSTESTTSSNQLGSTEPSTNREKRGNIAGVVTGVSIAAGVVLAILLLLLILFIIRKRRSYSSINQASSITKNVQPSAPNIKGDSVDNSSTQVVYSKPKKEHVYAEIEKRRPAKPVLVTNGSLLIKENDLYSVDSNVNGVRRDSAGVFIVENEGYGSGGARR